MTAHTASDTPLATFKLRRGRVTPTQAGALTRWWPHLGVGVDGSALDLAALFGRQKPVVLEIGFGMGEVTWQMASQQPDVDVLAIDVHTPGIGALFKLIEQHELTNVRVADGDARVLLGDMLAPESLDEVRVFFPDPWPKTRHVKRRLMTADFCDLVAGRLKPAGVLHLATDWAPYARAVGGVLNQSRHFEVLSAADVPPRPTTRFEALGLAAGRASYDIAARRVG